MMARFSGPEGKRRLCEAIRAQELVAGDGHIAEQLAAVATVEQYNPGDVIIREGDSDNDLFLICSGTVDVRVAGRLVAQRRAGQHVGEMALIDPSAPRAAEVRRRLYCGAVWRSNWAPGLENGTPWCDV